MEVSIQSREFIRKVLGVPIFSDTFRAKQVARDTLLYLEPKATPDRWIIILYNPELRADLIGMLLHIYKDDDDLDWSILLTKLEDDLEKRTKTVMGTSVIRELDEADSIEEAIEVFHEAFHLIGREAATAFTKLLLDHVVSDRKLMKKIRALAAVS